MKKSVFLSGLVAGLAFFSNLASAAIIVSINPAAYLSSPGVTSVDVLALSTDPLNVSDQLFSLVVDFTSTSASAPFANPAGAFALSTQGDLTPFWFSSIGDGGTLASSSSLSRGSASTASLSLDFSSSGTFRDTNTRIARLDFASTTPGTYPISLTVDALNATSQATAPAFNGTFTIPSAIPEPNSVVLLLAGVASIFGLRPSRRSAV